MAVVMALIGLIAGWLLNLASDTLPRFSPSHPATFSLVAPALWRVLRGQSRGPWLPLHLGVELVSAVVFAVLWLFVGASWTFLLVAGGYAFFLLIAIIDLKYRLVLNLFTYPAIAALLLLHMLILRQNTLSILLGGGVAFSIFYATALLKPGDLGGGDVKLAALIGFAFGFPQVLWALIAGAGTGAVAALYLLLARRNGLKRTIPYAPFLCLGAMVMLLYNALGG